MTRQPVDPGPVVALSNAAIGQLRQRVREDHARESGALARLRSGRPAAIGLLAGVVGVLGVVLVAVLDGRPGLSSRGLELVFELALPATLAGFSLWLALRPLHLPPLGPGLVLIPLVTAILPFLMAIFLGDHELHGFGPASCAWAGVVAALPSMTVLWLAERHRTSLVSQVAAGLFAGMAGYLAVGVHCPITSLPHLLAMHAPVVVLVAVIAAIRFRALQGTGKERRDV